jgi:hypothetical protein
VFLSEYCQSPQLPTKLTKPKRRRSWFRCKNRYWGSSLSFFSTPVVFQILCGAQTVTSITTELYMKMISYTEHPLENRKRRQSDCTQRYCASLEEKELLPGRRSISGRLSADPGGSRVQRATYLIIRRQRASSFPIESLHASSYIWQREFLLISWESK